MFLDYLALGFLIFGALVTFYLIIGIHDIPYEIAKKRNHPHQDAIHVAGWVSLMTLSSYAIPRSVSWTSSGIAHTPLTTLRRETFADYDAKK